jgi:hypothetical protein
VNEREDQRDDPEENGDRQRQAPNEIPEQCTIGPA